MKIVEKIKDVLFGKKKKIIIEKVHLGETKKPFSDPIVTGLAGGGPPHLHYDKIMGREVTITAREKESGDKFMSSYVACEMNVESLYKRYFDEKDLEFILQIEGREIEIRMKDELPDYLIKYILKNYR